MEHNQTLLDKCKPLSLTYRLAKAQSLLGAEKAQISPAELPQSFTLIYMGAKEDSRPEISPEHYQLYIDCHAVPSNKWYYDVQSKCIVFNTVRYGGHLRLPSLSAGCRGIVSVAKETYTAEYQSPGLAYELELAEGAAYVDTSGTVPVVRAYGEDTAEWKKAWQEYENTEQGKNPIRDRLYFMYSLEGTSLLAETIYEMSVRFKIPNGCQWSPRRNEYTCLMEEDFSINFMMGKYAKTGRGSSLFPYQLVGQLNAFGDTLTGAILTGENTENGIPYGIRGTYVDDSTVCGTYRLADGGTFCVTGGRLYIGGYMVENSQSKGKTLAWDFSEDNRREELSHVLPEKGVLEFSPDGSRIVRGSSPCDRVLLRNNKSEGIRLSADEAATSDEANILRNNEERLTSSGLLAMTPYRFDSKGQMHDVIQEQTMKDFQNLLEYYIPDELYKQFIGPVKELPDKLRNIAEMKTDDGKDAASTYESFAIAYLTCILSQVKDDEAAKTLNAKRANLHIKEEMPKNKMFLKQSPAIYRMEWLSEFPKMQDYIEDQKKNADYYASFINADREAWKKETEDELEDGTSYNTEIIEERKEHIDKLADTAISEGKYWAYFLMRYAMSDTFLREMQQLCIAPGKESANDLVHTTQQIMTLITLLDDSRQDSIFVQEYSRTIISFQMASVMPMFIDFSEMDEWGEFCNVLTDILKKFTEIYAGSSNEDIRDCVNRINSLTAEDYERLFRHVSQIFGQSECRKLQDYGFIEWETFVVDTAAAAFALSIFLSGKGEWSDLGEVDKAMLGTHIAHLIGIELLAGGIRRGALIHMLAPTEGFWSRFGSFIWFSKATREMAANAAGSLSLSFKRWFLVGVDMTGQGMAEAAKSLKYGWFFSKKSMKIFGRSFKSFMLRVGCLFAIADIAFSIYYLITDEGQFLQASNGLFLASSVLDIVSMGMGIAEVTGCLAIGATVIGVLGVVLAVIGFIVWAVYIFGQKEDTPVKIFACNEAKKHGFYMPEGYAVDCFEVIPSSQGQPSKDCTAIYAGEDRYSLKVHCNGDISTDKFNGKMEMAFKIDATGDSAHILLLLKNNEGIVTPRYLTRIGKEVKAMPFSDSKESGQEWKCNATSVSIHDKEGMLLKANFTLSDCTEQQFLTLTEDKKGIRCGERKTEWTLEMKPSLAEELNMEDVRLRLSDRNKVFTPLADSWGCLPRLFSVHPSLPDFMGLDKESGRIYQKEGVAPKAMESRYTLSLKDGLDNSVSDDFVLNII